MERLAAQILVQEELVSALAALYTAPQEPVQGAVKKLPPQIRLYRQPQRFYEIRNTPPPHPQRRTMLTASGEKVRSKSEVILADRLAGNGLEYYYEPGILLGEQVFHPDFLIRLPGREDFVLWEHRGLTEAAYLQSWNEKILLYRDQGILEGSNLFVSYDTADGGLDSYGIQRRIEAFLFPSGVFSETA